MSETVVKPPEIKDPVQAEQLLCYFIFRHLYPDYLSTTCSFAVLSLYMTEKAAEQCGIFVAARLYSSEIEYSDENTDIIFEALNEGVF